MTTAAPGVTVNEMLAVMGARELSDHQTVFTGVGAPMMASVLAQRLHAPHLTMVVEGGIVGPQWKPGWLPISTNEMRAAYRAQMLPAITDIFLMAQRGFLDVGFIGGAQIDQYGNLNTSAIGSYARPKVKLPGSGGANDIISLCREVIILTAHEPRRFVEKVDFITSPGHLTRWRLAPPERAPLRRREARGHHARALRLRAGEPADAARGRSRGRDGGPGPRQHAVRPPGGRPRGDHRAPERRASSRFSARSTPSASSSDRDAESILGNFEVWEGCQ